MMVELCVMTSLLLMSAASGTRPITRRATFVEELAARTLEARRWQEIPPRHALDVALHEVEEARLLRFAHRRKRCDDDLGCLELDQMMQLDALLSNAIREPGR